MKMLVVLLHIHQVHLVQAHLDQAVVDHLVLRLVPLQELLHPRFLQLFQLVDLLLVQVDANVKLKIINALLAPLVQRVLLVDLALMDILGWMVLLVLMLKMLPQLIILPPGALIAQQGLKGRQVLWVNLALGDYLAQLE